MRGNRRYKALAVVVAGVLAAAIAPSVMGQQAGQASSAPGAAVEAGTRLARTRDEELYLLDARQAKLALERAMNEMEEAKAALDETQVLYDEKIVTIAKLNEAKQAYDEAVLKHKQARIDQEKKRLDFLKGATMITLVDAIKYRSEDGETMVRICLRNDSDINKARIAMEDIENLSEQALSTLLNVNNVLVRLKGLARVTTGVGPEGEQTATEKAIVGHPIEHIIPQLNYGQQVALEYSLRKTNVESVTVSLEFLGTQKDYDVFLMKESQQDLPVITSGQYSQIGQLGSKVTYKLYLDRLAKTEQAFSLVVLNLPQELEHGTWDASGEARLTEVRFTSDLEKQVLNLRISIPEKLNPKLVDANIPFYFLATRRTELKNIAEVARRHAGQTIPPDEIARLKASYVELSLIPRGVPKLEILAPNLFKEVVKGEPFTLKFNLINSGTLSLRRVAPELDLPLEWEGEADPKQIEEISPGDKHLVKVDVRPPNSVDVGDYTVKVMSKGHSGAESIEAMEKTFTIRVAAESSITGTVILVVVLIVLVLGIAIASIKISRR